jgi:protein gp37
VIGRSGHEAVLAYSAQRERAALSRTTRIEWADHAHARHFGCTKVSRGCDNCYAESWTRRFKKAGWGPHAERIRAKAATLRRPIAWNRKAERAGKPAFVFCSHESDVFDNQAPDAWRAEFWRLIEATPHLVWLLLTKRPQNVMRMIPPAWRSGLPRNVWIGTSAEGQAEAEQRLPVLCRIPAVRRFVSAEPLLEAVDLSPWLDRIDWVIAGAESGPRHKARPMDLDWVRNLRDQCVATDVAFFFKQDARDGVKIPTPELDGRRWTERPSPVLSARP